MRITGMDRMEWNHATTLRNARQWLSDRLSTGAVCPCCNQTAKVYKRKLHATIAKALIALHNAGGDHHFVHAPSLPGDTHEISQASWWGLIEEEQVEREDGGRAGWWRLTELGILFVRGATSISTYARVYNGRAHDFEGAPRTIRDCLGTKFRYDDLMQS